MLHPFFLSRPFSSSHKVLNTMRTPGSLRPHYVCKPYLGASYTEAKYNYFNGFLPITCAFFFHMCLSDFGFRQTLEVRTLGCARDFAPTYLHPSASLRSKLWKEQHERHRVYTGSGHCCGVIPYSSVWHGGLPLGLMMMNNTRKNSLARVCSWLGQ